MNLIAILIALALEHWSIGFHPRHHLQWLPHGLRRAVEALGSAGDGPLGVFVVLALPALLMALAYAGLAWLTPLLAVVLATVVLAACLKGHELGVAVDQLRDMLQRGDEEGARVVASSIVGRPIHSAGAALEREVAEGILIEANERVFAVLFWFMLAGPVGALVYRLSGTLDRLAPESNTHFFAAACRFHWVLGWLPARLTVIGYALAGSFGHAMEHRSDSYGDSDNSNSAVLASGGMGAILALEPVPPADLDLIVEAKALVVRAVAAWVAVAAVVLLAS